MLLIKRKPGESLIIGNVIVHILEPRGGGGVRLGIEAPDDVVILRPEVLGRVQSGPCLVEVESSRNSVDAK